MALFEGMVCDACGEDIEPGDPVINLFFGLVGCSPKSGRPIAVDNPYVDYNEANLHEWCVAKFARLTICDDQLDDERYCSACESKLEGDAG